MSSTSLLRNNREALVWRPAAVNQYKQDRQADEEERERAGRRTEEI